MGCASSVRAAAAIIAIGLLASSLAGCGRRGALEPPPDPRAVAANGGDQLQPLGRPPTREPIKPPHDPFVLDPLL